MLQSFGSIAEEEPCNISASLTAEGESQALLSVVVKVSPGYFLYADQFKVEVPDSVEVLTKRVPRPETKTDAFGAGDKEVFTRDFTAVYEVSNLQSNMLPVTVHYQACRQDMCFLPDSKSFVLTLKRKGSASAVSVQERKSGDSVSAVSKQRRDWRSKMRNFTVVASRTGYMNVTDFLEFLDSAERGIDAQSGNAHRLLTRGSLWVSLIIILLGGLALNLTPCVLPMIPINIAIIGAGAQAGARMRGFVLGALYGAGIALAYGALGVIVVLTGSMFGAINASLWFNFGIAILFILLSLAMFDVFFIDLSRFQARIWEKRSGIGDSSAKGTIHAKILGALVVLLMGMTAAVLAGACVAPVVISVLLLSADMYTKGNIAGLLLPCLLGLGMALPWPFVGAGLSFLPKPGKWMNRVKYAFGVFILIMAVYYAAMGIMLLRQRLSGSEETFRAVPETGDIRPVSQLDRQGLRSIGDRDRELRGDWLASLSEALALAEKERKPVIVNFSASWCKNCHAMDLTTLRDPAVQMRMMNFVKVKYRAERPNQSPAKEVLEAFGVLGLPTYVILSLKP